jgi:hypothetical protein
MTDIRELIELTSVGPATLADLEDLGITEVDHLIDKSAGELFEELQQLKGQKLDPCCEDVFRAAIEQARDPNLPIEKRQWHYWSKVRKRQLGE